MGSVDRLEDRTFKVNFTGEGAAKLREKVNDKLKEFMGDYTDDTLVEYVIVLLRNGRRMEEARNELNVFLGDDSDSFVAWLWDHLASNLDLYVQSQDSIGVVETKSSLGDHASRSESSQVVAEFGKGKTENLSRNRNKREWKGLMRDVTEPPLLRSAVVDTMHMEERSHAKAGGRSSSPDPPKQKKRSRQDERQHLKREDVSQATNNASRRLLQFAVRDAVGTLRHPGLVKEPSMKRLRSVVSTSTANSSLYDHPRRIRSIARVPNPLATVIKAVQEAAEDVKVKSARSVFDRLGQDMEMTDAAEQIREIGDAAVENEQFEEFDCTPERINSIYSQGHDYAEDGENVGMAESESGLAVDLEPDYEVYADDRVLGLRVVDISETSTSGGIRRQDSRMVQYNLPKRDTMQISQNKDHNGHVSATKTAASISVNSINWKPTCYQESRKALEMDNLKPVQENERDSKKSGIQLMKENSNHVFVGNGNAIPAADVQKESLKTLQILPGTNSAGRPLEDADSRSIFISNVHFAATKDGLSRHFNKFGEVLKVVIMTDAATGQPKGSAYVEFMRKAAADNALSLDGTSFMSRILKVVKRSAANQEVAPVSWPRVSRGSPYATGRFNRIPFPRGIPGAFRARLPMKPGARSLQWKRDAQTTTAEIGATPVSGNLVSPTARSLTYIRTEPKSDGSSSAA